MFEETTAERNGEKKERRRSVQKRCSARSGRESGGGGGRGGQDREGGREGCIMRVCDGGLSLTLHVVSREPQRSEAESEVK